MGISDEAMKPLSAPKEVMDAAMTQIQPEVEKITQEMINGMMKQLERYENKPNSAKVRAAAKETILGYLMSLHERGFLMVEPPFEVEIKGGVHCLEISIDPYPFPRHF